MVYPHPLSTHNSKSSLNQPKQVGSWWNFHRSFWWMLAPIWHHLQVHQECPCPPRLQEETWRTGGVLTWFLMSDLDETFTDTSDECSLQSDTISRSIWNIHVLLESRKRHGGQEKFWHGCWYYSDLDKTSYKEDKTSSQTISPIVESNCYIT